MSVKNLFKTMKSSEGYLVPAIEMHLSKAIDRNDGAEDRATNVNSPSQVNACLRARYYARTSVKKDGKIETRLQRIFDNGSHVHDRIQEYLVEDGYMLVIEVPIFDDDFEIQGHTDGIFGISADEIGVAELKSINTDNFKKLAQPKEEHVAQAMVYLHCLEKRRQYLQETYSTLEDFHRSRAERADYFLSHQKHVKDGRKRTRVEKLRFNLSRFLKADEVLYRTSTPIQKCSILYEDKNDQNLKEFVVKRDDVLLKYILRDYRLLNKCIRMRKPPKREGDTKSCQFCRNCDYRYECWR